MIYNLYIGCSDVAQRLSNTPLFGTLLRGTMVAKTPEKEEFVLSRVEIVCNLTCA